MKRRILFSSMILVLMLSSLSIPARAYEPPGFTLVVQISKTSQDGFTITGTYSCINEEEERSDFTPSTYGNTIHGHEITCLGEIKFRIDPYCCTNFYKGGAFEWQMKLLGDGIETYYSDFDMQPSEDLITFHDYDILPDPIGIAPPSGTPTSWRFHFAWPGGYQSESYYEGTIYLYFKVSTGPIIAPPTSDCADQYTLGQLITTLDVWANQANGTDAKAALAGRYPNFGDWYAVKVDPNFRWKNNGAGDDLKAFKMSKYVFGVNLWDPVDTENPAIGCYDEDDDTYYLQLLPANDPLRFAVYDTDGNYPSNTGELKLAIYTVVSFNAWPSGCALTYDIGNLIEQKTVMADFPNGQALASGIEFPWPHDSSAPGNKRYFMLETYGGPARLGASGGYSWDSGLGVKSNEPLSVPSTWYESKVAPFVECVQILDMVGHVRVFFPMDENYFGVILKHYYAFRVHDTGSFDDNTGSLSYKLYQATFIQATEPGEPPGPTGCSGFTHDASPTATITIPASLSGGVSMPVLYSGTMYALETQAGPWKDNGADSYNVQLSDDDGVTWVDMASYPYLLCAQSADGNHVLIYVYGRNAAKWKARVKDGNSNYFDNTLSINLAIYEGQTDINNFPSCQDNYTLTKVALGDEDRKVPGNASGGKSVPAILMNTPGTGAMYSIEITDEHQWFEGGSSTGQYLVDISQDGGSNWTNLEDYGVCTIQLGTDSRYQIYFYSVSNNYILRVRDGDDDFASNTGFIMFELYTGFGYSSEPGEPGTPPPEWVVTCQESYSRPDSLLTWYPIGEIGGVTISVPIPRVGEWIDYLRSALTFYLAWCPQHTEAIQNIGSVILTKEPLVTIKALLEFVQNIKTILLGYQTAGGEAMANGLTSQEPNLFSDTQYIDETGGAEHYNTSTSNTPWDIFMIGDVNPNTYVLYGGQIDMAASLGSSDLSSMSAYQTLCSTKFYPLFGIGANSFCSLMAMMRYSKVATWILLGLDLFIMVWFILKYIPSYISRFWSLITGNKRLVGKVINNL